MTRISGARTNSLSLRLFSLAAAITEFGIASMMTSRKSDQRIVSQDSVGWKSAALFTSKQIAVLSCHKIRFSLSDFTTEIRKKTNQIRLAFSRALLCQFAMWL